MTATRRRKTARPAKKAGAKGAAKRRGPPVRAVKGNAARRPSRAQIARDTQATVEQAVEAAVRQSRKAARKVKEGLRELFSG